MKLYYLLFLFLLTACTNDIDVDGNEPVAAGNLFLDYQIMAEEGRDFVIVLLQFKRGGQNGNSVALDRGRSVELNGQQLIVDSANITGAFYEAEVPFDDFVGKNTITFTDVDGQQYVEEFEFIPLELQTSLTGAVSRTNFNLQFKGAMENEVVRVTLHDTDFDSDDINTMETINNGILELSEHQLQKVINGPVFLHVFREQEYEIRGGRRGGRMSITYVLRRQFELRP